MGIPVSVFDGRVGRDPELVIEGRGGLLMIYESETPLDIGSRIMLSDGAIVEVIGIENHLDPDKQEWRQDAIVGGIWGES